MLYARYNNNQKSVQIKILNKNVEYFMNRVLLFISILTTSTIFTNFENNQLLNKDIFNSNSKIIKDPVDLIKTKL